MCALCYTLFRLSTPKNEKATLSDGFLIIFYSRPFV
ncbi:hypothetical protein [Escherichia phage FL20]